MQIRYFLCYLIGISIGILFMIPIFMYRILSIGNLTGIGAGIVLFCTTFLYHTKSDLTEKFFFKIILWFMGLIFIMVLYLTSLMIGSLFRKPKEHATVVVLGAKVIGNRPSLVLEERLIAAKRYLDEHPDAVAILSGGQGADEIITEAEGMYRYLVEQGVAKSRLIKEERSTSTAENIQFSLELIEGQNLPKELAIVTNEFHIYRSLYIAGSMGLEAGSVPAKSRWWLFPTYFVRELYAILYEWVR